MNNTDVINGLFNCLRPRLHGIVYRMLGSHDDTEQLVQDTWLRWHQWADSAIDKAKAWLASLVTHMAIDRPRAAEVEREH